MKAIFVILSFLYSLPVVTSFSHACSFDTDCSHFKI